jgi:serine/threonine-protein kinase SRPK3
LDVFDKEGWGTNEEGISAYVYGGLHPVQIGEVYGGRYKVIRKLGYGRESTTWLAENQTYINSHIYELMGSTNEAVALKIIAANAGDVELQNILRL